MNCIRDKTGSRQKNTDIAAT